MKKILVIAVLLSIGFIACKDKGPDPVKIDSNTTKMVSYSIMGTYPHDTSSYTEGFLIYNGSIYESGGNYGFSKLKKKEITSGKVLQEVSLDKKYFGEGIAILNDTLYQLTYKEKKAFAYTVKDLKKVKEFDVNIEGWGMTTDGKYLIASAGGTSELNYFDPSTFKLVKTQTVTEGGSPIADINELEYINGYIYANQYGQPYILKIDPATGQVVSKTDLTRDWDRIKQMRPDVNVMDIVPNGIAYDSASKKMFITGKWWPEMYEIQLSQ